MSKANSAQSGWTARDTPKPPEPRPSHPSHPGATRAAQANSIQSARAAWAPPQPGPSCRSFAPEPPEPPDLPRLTKSKVSLSPYLSVSLSLSPCVYLGQQSKKFRRWCPSHLSLAIWILFFLIPCHDTIEQKISNQLNIHPPTHPDLKTRPTP